MEKSIEAIWKEGFLSSDAMVAPKVNELYEQKSLCLTEKFRRSGQLNLIGIAVMAVVFLISSIFLGVPYTGAAIFLLLTIAFVFGFLRLRNMKQLDKGLDTYSYLRVLNEFLNETIASYTRMYRFLYPAITLAILQGTWSLGGFKERFFQNSSTIQFVSDMPITVFVGAIFIAALTAVFAAPIYRFDINFVYGRLFRKLDELLADMETLRT